MIVVVSDIHLGYEKSNKDDFLRFLEACDSSSIDRLILLGDILDFWRRNNAKAVLENEKIVAKIADLNVKKVHYIVGNHDYCLLKFHERSGEQYPFPISKSLRLEDGGKKFYCIHGYELEVLENLEPLSIEDYEKVSEKLCFTDDVLSWLEHLMDLFQTRGRIWKQVEMMKKPSYERENISQIYNLAISRAKYMLLGMKMDENLVYGHTHRPFLDDKGTVANTGSWVKELPEQKYVNTYLKILDGRMELNVFDEKTFP